MGRGDKRSVKGVPLIGHSWMRLGVARMKKIFGVTREFIAENPSAAIAVASFFVSGLSLIYTLQAQKSDVLYKELSIKPALVLRYETSDFSLKIANVGIGPAVVKAITISDGKRCINSRNLPIEKWSSAVREVMPDIFNAVFREIWSALSAAGGAAFRPAVSSKILFPGQYIQNGSEYVIAKAGDNDIKRFSESAGIQSEIRQSAMRSFAEKAERLAIKIEYCSVSEKFCAELGNMTCSNSP